MLRVGCSLKKTVTTEGREKKVDDFKQDNKKSLKRDREHMSSLPEIISDKQTKSAQTPVKTTNVVLVLSRMISFLEGEVRKTDTPTVDDEDDTHFNIEGEEEFFTKGTEFAQQLLECFRVLVDPSSKTFFSGDGKLTDQYEQYDRLQHMNQVMVMFANAVEKVNPKDLVEAGDLRKKREEEKKEETVSSKK